MPSVQFTMICACGMRLPRIYKCYKVDGLELCLYRSGDPHIVLKCKVARGARVILPELPGVIINEPFATKAKARTYELRGPDITETVRQVSDCDSISEVARLLRPYADLVQRFRIAS